ncbi:MAG TPA: aldo/keto reductase [Candidatus Obscuribacterales bacterium]
MDEAGSGDKQHLSRRDFLGLAGAALVGSAFTNAITASAADTMPYRILGRTKEKVSLIGLGGYHIGVPRDDKEAIKIMRTAIDSGINFLDNCWDYHGGASELRMGEALKNGYRDKVFLMTKIDGRTRKAAAEQIDECLRRFRTDVIDLMQVHEVIRKEDADRVFGPSGAMEALLAAKKAGKIRYIGFTGHKSPAMHLNFLNVAFRNNFTFDAVQMPLNVMDAHYDSFEKEVLPVLLKHDIGVLGMKPLGAGVILKTGIVTPIECLQYAMSLQTSVVITGMTSMDELKQALTAAKTFKPFTPAQRAALLQKTATLAAKGKYEMYKSTYLYDGTRANPHWMG